MMTESVSFANAQGQMLAGKIDRPTGTPEAVAIFAHHFAGSKDVLAAVRISRALAQRGIAVLRFDFTGLGSSEGQFKDTTFSTNVADIISAAQFLEDQGMPPHLLVGHSLGGAAALAAAAHIPSVQTVASIGTPSDPAHVSHAFRNHLTQLAQGETVTIQVGPQALKISPAFWSDIQTFSLLQTVPTLNAAIMVFHAPSDDVVCVEHARKLYEAARHPKSFVSLDRADHLLRDPQDALFIAEILGPWAKRYRDATRL